MRIAAISDDGTTISQHFGRAPIYVVVTVEDGKVVGKENRPKFGHQSFAASESHSDSPGQRHGYDAGSQSKHTQMADAISDCSVLLVGGMGWGAYDSLKSYGIEPIATDIVEIDDAVEAYLNGTIENLMERLH